MVEVHLRAVRVDLGSSTPVVLLEETEGARRSLPIFVGGPGGDRHRLRPPRRRAARAR